MFQFLLLFGCILVASAFVMYLLLIRDSNRRPIEVKLEKVSYKHVRQDKKKMNLKHRHGHVKYDYGERSYEGLVLLKSNELKAGDWVKITVHPKKPDHIRIYAPKREIKLIRKTFIAGLILIAIGSLILSLSG